MKQLLLTSNDSTIPINYQLIKLSGILIIDMK